jgi:hypothetical protein
VSDSARKEGRKEGIRIGVGVGVRIGVVGLGFWEMWMTLNWLEVTS